MTCEILIQIIMMIERWFKSSFKLNTKLNWKSDPTCTIESTVNINTYRLLLKHVWCEYIDSDFNLDLSKLRNFNVKTCNLHAPHKIHLATIISTLINQIQIKVICRNEQKNMQGKLFNTFFIINTNKTSEIRMVSFLWSNFSNDTTKNVSMQKL